MALIDGAVEKPGLYPVVGRTTLQQVVAQAGGLKEYAILEKFVIIRKIDGKTMAAIYNLKDIRQGTYHDPEVFAGDTIAVGDSVARRIMKDVMQYSTLPLLIYRP